MAGPGRPKGSRNKRPAYARMAMRKGELPLDYLLDIMNDDEQPAARRLRAAKAAAPYCHPKLKQITVGDSFGADSHPNFNRMTNVEIAEYVTNVLAEIEARESAED